MSNEIGLCPICQKPLKSSGEFIECPGNHFRVRLTEWDKAWSDYIKAHERNCETLLQTLINLNLK